jgi:hypothetical protein
MRNESRRTLERNHGNLITSFTFPLPAVPRKRTAKLRQSVCDNGISMVIVERSPLVFCDFSVKFEKIAYSITVIRIGLTRFGTS